MKYCTKCKYFDDWDDGELFWGQDCTHPSNKAIERNFMGNRVVYISQPKYLNKNNDCVNYDDNLSKWESIKRYVLYELFIGVSFVIALIGAIILTLIICIILF